MFTLRSATLLEITIISLMSLISLKGLEAGFVCVCGGGICTVVRYFCSFTIISAGQSKELDGSKMSCTSVGAHVEKEKAYSTWYSQAVSHPSTNQARPCLASEIRRDRACFFFVCFFIIKIITFQYFTFNNHIQHLIKNKHKNPKTPSPKQQNRQTTSTQNK